MKILNLKRHINDTKITLLHGKLFILRLASLTTTDLKGILSKQTKGVFYVSFCKIYHHITSLISKAFFFIKYAKFLPLLYAIALENHSTNLISIQIIKKVLNKEIS